MVNFFARAEHLRGELIVMEFADSYIVSDHPARFGGTGRGPSPGEFLMISLVSSMVLAATGRAAELGVAMKSAVARMNMRMDREGATGPLGALAYMAQAWRQLELVGDFSDEQLADIQNAAQHSGIATAIRQGVGLDEWVLAEAAMSSREATLAQELEVNDILLSQENKAREIPEGEIKIGELEPSWRLSAIALDADTVGVALGRSMLVVGRHSGLKRGPTPEEMLCAGIAGCTTIFLARNAVFFKIPLEHVEVHVSGRIAADGSLGDLEKVARIRGDLTDVERNNCDYFAEHCAIGETVKRGMPIHDTMIANRSAGVQNDPSLDSLAQTAPPPAYVVCDDSSCCIPGALESAG